MSLTALPNTSLPSPTFEDALEKLEKLYPGRSTLVQISGNGGEKFGRVINYLKAPVPNYHNKKRDLVEVELMAKIGTGKDAKFAPYSPAQIIRSHTGLIKIIGAV